MHILYSLETMSCQRCRGGGWTDKDAGCESTDPVIDALPDSRLHMIPVLVMDSGGDHWVPQDFDIVVPVYQAT